VAEVFPLAEADEEGREHWEAHGGTPRLPATRA
jgi:hypothetical protein